MKKINKKIVVNVILVIIVILFGQAILPINYVEAAVNKSYSTSSIDSSWLNNVLGGSILVSPLAYLLLAIASIIEYFLSLIGSIGSGSAVMPWADAILFNAVPLLDVNFINPNSSSIIINLNGLIQKIYSTIFSLCISFFTISILLMAVRIAISTIAEEKAKYKSAITNWLIGLLLLFSIHYFMAFVFYLNENLVTVASEIVEDQTKNVEDILGVTYQSTADDINSKINATSMDNEEKDYYNEIVNGNMELIFDLSGYKQIQNIFDRELLNAYGTDEEIIEAYMALVITIINVKDNNTIINLESTTNPSVIYEWIDDINNDYQNEYYNLDSVAKVFADTNAYNLDIKTIQYTFNVREMTKRENEIRNAIVGLAPIYSKNIGTYKQNGEKRASFVSTLGIYFRIHSFNYKNGSLYEKDGINLGNTIIYFTFVVQSLLYFFSYLRRFFYIIVLAVMAPVMVVYNFIATI